MAKKVFAIILIVVLSITVMTGCKKVVEKETFEAPVKIINTDYDAFMMYPTKVGKTTMYITKPAKYNVTMEYNGVEYTIDNSKAYKAAEKKAGTMMNAVIVKLIYDDGSTEIEMTDLVYDN